MIFIYKLIKIRYINFVMLQIKYNTYYVKDYLYYQ